MVEIILAKLIWFPKLFSFRYVTEIIYSFAINMLFHLHIVIYNVYMYCLVTEGH